MASAPDFAVGWASEPYRTDAGDSDHNFYELLERLAAEHFRELDVLATHVMQYQREVAELAGTPLMYDPVVCESGPFDTLLERLALQHLQQVDKIQARMSKAEQDSSALRKQLALLGHMAASSSAQPVPESSRYGSPVMPTPDAALGAWHAWASQAQLGYATPVSHFAACQGLSNQAPSAGGCYTYGLSSAAVPSWAPPSLVQTAQAASSWQAPSPDFPQGPGAATAAYASADHQPSWIPRVVPGHVGLDPELLVTPNYGTDRWYSSYGNNARAQRRAYSAGRSSSAHRRARSSDSEVELWEELKLYFDHLEGDDKYLPRDRIYCAKELARRNVPCLLGRSIDDVLRIVKLAVGRKRLLGNRDGYLVPYRDSMQAERARSVSTSRYGASWESSQADRRQSWGASTRFGFRNEGQRDRSINEFQGEPRDHREDDAT